MQWKVDADLKTETDTVHYVRDAELEDAPPYGRDSGPGSVPKRMLLPVWTMVAFRIAARVRINGMPLNLDHSYRKSVWQGKANTHTSKRCEGQMLLAMKLYSVPNECKAPAWLVTKVLLCWNKYVVEFFSNIKINGFPILIPLLRSLGRPPMNFSLICTSTLQI